MTHNRGIQNLNARHRAAAKAAHAQKKPASGAAKTKRGRFRFNDPDAIGSSEYRAIFGTLVDVNAISASGDVRNIGDTKAILREFGLWAAGQLTALEAHTDTLPPIDDAVTPYAARVLVEVNGGVANLNADKRVDVYLVDWDDLSVRDPADGLPDLPDGVTWDYSTTRDGEPVGLTFSGPWTLQY